MSSSIRVDLAQHLLSLPSPPLVLSIYFTAHCGEHYLASKFEPTAHSVQCPLKITVSVAHHITVSVAHHTTVSVAHPIFCCLGLRSFCLSIPPLTLLNVLWCQGTNLLLILCSVLGHQHSSPLLILFDVLKHLGLSSPDAAHSLHLAHALSVYPASRSFRLLIRLYTPSV